jgi:hypothetical protein
LQAGALAAAKANLSTFGKINFIRKENAANYWKLACAVCLRLAAVSY